MSEKDEGGWKARWEEERHGTEEVIIPGHCFFAWFCELLVRLLYFTSYHKDVRNSLAHIHALTHSYTLAYTHALVYLIKMHESLRVCAL